MTRTEEF